MQYLCGWLEHILKAHNYRVVPSIVNLQIPYRKEGGGHVEDPCILRCNSRFPHLLSITGLFMTIFVLAMVNSPFLPIKNN
jgi:hypothetical protein